MDSGTPTRRRLLMLAAGGSISLTAGCINTPTSGQVVSEEPANYCLDQLDESVPEAEATALSIDGVERQPAEELLPKDEAGYACGPQDGMLCGNCTFYIDDKNGNAIGACAVVAGEVRSVDWCGLWAPRDGFGGANSE
ncbi:high-potential iron-sulfur protein [Halovivax cerinus]|uniref:High-potential iron-sulfur protein n=1 Tax=Halovivax cerinus TaxID=1487865 RepID=A0ABD5NNX2_9EURY|nr:high-potential iron-sulfur protein [Halovivax cerinus]